MVDGRVGIVVILGHCQHLLALSIVEELATLVEELEGVPLAWVVRCCDDDAAISHVCDNCHLCARGGAEAYVDNIYACAEECSLDK